jgi:hypothetical protein
MILVADVGVDVVLYGVVLVGVVVLYVVLHVDGVTFACLAS